MIFGLVLVSRDFEVGRNFSSEESTVCPVWGYFFSFFYVVVYFVMDACLLLLCYI